MEHQRRQRAAYIERLRSAYLRGELRDALQEVAPAPAPVDDHVPQPLLSAVMPHLFGGQSDSAEDYS